MGYWAEIHNTYMETSSEITPHEGDLLASISIDAWRTADEDEEGSVIARVLLSLHGDIIVDYIDQCARNDEAAQASIEEAKEILRNHYAEGQKPEENEDQELLEYIAEYICLNNKLLRITDQEARQVSHDMQLVKTMASHVMEMAQKQGIDPFDPDHIGLIHDVFNAEFPALWLPYQAIRSNLIADLRASMNHAGIFWDSTKLTVKSDMGQYRHFMLDPLKSGSQKLYCQFSDDGLILPVVTDIEKVERNTVVLARGWFNSRQYLTDIHCADESFREAYMQNGPKRYVTDSETGEVIFEEMIDVATTELIADLLYGNILKYSTVNEPF